METATTRYKVVYTTGVFDLLHHGHINLLNKAKKLGNWLIVGLVDDDAVRQQKGEGRPVLSYAQRRDLLLSLKCVSEVVQQKSFDPTTNLRGRQIDVIVKGEDQDHISEEYAKEHEIPIVRFERTKGVSTTEMINAGGK
jgi:rfaE bifunctional protein nucleotidyltransferase chain/domain